MLPYVSGATLSINTSGRLVKLDKPIKLSETHSRPKQEFKTHTGCCRSTRDLQGICGDITDVPYTLKFIRSGIAIVDRNKFGHSVDTPGIGLCSSTLAVSGLLSSSIGVAPMRNATNPLKTKLPQISVCYLRVVP